jgi:hypothetical protein
VAAPLDGLAVVPAGFGEADDVAAGLLGVADPVDPAPLPDDVADGVVLPAGPPVSGEGEPGGLAVPL